MKPWEHFLTSVLGSFFVLILSYFMNVSFTQDALMFFSVVGLAVGAWITLFEQHEEVEFNLKKLFVFGLSLAFFSSYWWPETINPFPWVFLCPLFAGFTLYSSYMNSQENFEFRSWSGLCSLAANVLCLGCIIQNLYIMASFFLFLDTLVSAWRIKPANNVGLFYNQCLCTSAFVFIGFNLLCY